MLTEITIVVAHVVVEATCSHTLRRLLLTEFSLQTRSLVDESPMRDDTWRGTPNRQD
jgi:hypothetical protein